MFGLFSSKPVLDPSESQWLSDTFNWCLDNFDSAYFYQHSVLVEPSNEFFPGRVDSVPGMAELIFERVKAYAGVSHWPTRVSDMNACAIEQQPRIVIEGPLRIADGQEDKSLPDEQRLVIPYNPQQVSNPEGLIATFAHTLAHYMGQMAKQPPPGGVEYWPHATELLAIYLGFGLMFANSAYTFRGGCGSCYNPNANRDAYLTERQSTYALAIFSVLKQLPPAVVAKHLKSHLRGFFKQACKSVQSDPSLVLPAPGQA